MRAPWNIFCLGLLLPLCYASTATAQTYNIRDYGAVGDGVAIDSEAVNRAIDAAVQAGGGTVWVPAGTYACYSIRLQSNITLHLDNGATLLAADPPLEGQGGYDAAEPNVWGDEHAYQDFGHSHWHNSLIWGENLSSVAITGHGTIDGRGLGGGRRFLLPSEREDLLTFAEQPQQGGRRRRGGRGGGGRGGGERRVGSADKAIALKACRNVTLRDVTIFRAGHFALLATGVDNLTIDNLRVDTNRDGFDIDACRNVRVTNCLVNSPNDDAIVLKSSYALGEFRDTENVTIANCQVSGYAIGSLLDGTFDRSVTAAPDRDGPTGRIKLGTESNGGFKNITITGCVFDHCRGLALESVDGGTIEDILISNLTMRDVVNSPIFIRLGARMRGPEGTPVGRVRRVSIDNVIVHNADARYASQIVGLAGNPIQQVSINNLRITYQGGLTMEQVALQPADLVNTFFLRRGDPEAIGPREPYSVPEQRASYPEPSMFGLLPAYGFYIRHAEGIKLRNVELGFLEPDTRPAIVLNDVSQVELSEVDAPTLDEVPTIVARKVLSLTTHRVDGIEDKFIEKLDDEAY